MAKDYAALPYDYRREMGALSDAEFGRLIRALLDYCIDGTKIAPSGNERFFAERVMMTEDKYADIYRKMKEQKSEAGKLGAAARASNAKQSQAPLSTVEQSQANEANINLNLKLNSNDNRECIYTRTRTREDDGFSEFWEAYPRKSGDILSAYYEYAAAIDGGAKPEELLQAVRDYPWPEEMRYIPSAEKWLKNRSWTEKPQERAVKKSSNKGRLGITDTLAVLNELREEYKEAGI